MPRLIRYPPDAARHVLILTNPTAGSGANRSVVKELIDRLATNGIEAEITSDLERVADLGARPAQAGLRAVVAAGGDGTVAAIVNRTHPDTPIAVLPLGTENLLAKYLHMLVKPHELSDAITHGATIRVDAGQAGDQLFMLMAGCGFDAEVVRRLHAERTGHIRHLSYVKPIIDSIRRYQYPMLRVHCHAVDDGDAVVKDSLGLKRAGETLESQRSFTARWLFIVNLPRYAGGLRMVPQAVGTDGLLDICGFERGSMLDGLRYLSGIVRGQHLAWPDCHYVRAKSVRIESDADVPYQLDGDPGGKLPLEITTLPERVSLIVTESWAMHRGFRH